MKKLSRKALIKKADTIFSEYIRTRDNWTCQICGKKIGIQCGHLFSRSNYSTRWNAKNAFAVCAGCNLRHEFNFEIMRRVYVNKYGEAQLDEVWALHNTIKKYYDHDLDVIIRTYQTEIVELKKYCNNEKKNYTNKHENFTPPY